MPFFWLDLIACSLAGSIISCIALGIRSLNRRMPAETKEWIWLPVYVSFLLPFALRIDFPLWTMPASFTKTWYAIVHFFHVSAPVFCFIWAIGLAVLCIIALRRYRELIRKNSLDACIEDIVVSKEADSPLTVGILRPRILLPEGLTEDETRFILLHENAHRKRHDPIKKLIVFLITLIHWFNPAVWLLFPLYENDLEMACDERAASALSRMDRARYAMTLLYYKPSGITSLTNAYKSHDSAMKQRIANITSSHDIVPSHKAIYSLSVIVLCILSILAPYSTHALLEAPQSPLKEVVLSSAYLRNWQDTVDTDDPVNEYLFWFSPEALSRIDHTEKDAQGNLHLYLETRYYERQLKILRETIDDWITTYKDNGTADITYDEKTHTLSISCMQEDLDLVILNLLYPIHEYEAWSSSCAVTDITIKVHVSDGTDTTYHACSYALEYEQEACE